MSKRYSILTAGLALVFLALSLTADASPVAPTADGDLDPTFGAGGKVTTPFLAAASGEAHAVAIQADGKFVAAGDGDVLYDKGFALTRYNPDGSLDTTFGDRGIVRTKLSGYSDRANAVAIQPDGKIVAAGYRGIDVDAYGDFAAVRYNPDGSLDTTFATGGEFSISLDVGQDLANAVLLQPDGKIVIAGTDGYPPGYHFAFVRLNPDGSLDNTFGAGGIVRTRIGEAASVYALAMQLDGKIVAAGLSASSNPNQSEFAVARYLPDGSLDTTFSGDGTTTILLGTYSGPARGVVISNDGKITVAGSANIAPNSVGFGLARLLPDGSLDPSFDGDGEVITLFADGYAYPNALVLQPNGAVVADGYIITGGNTSEFALARYLTNGSLDPSFDGDGIVTASFPQSMHSQLYGLAIAPGGSLIGAGVASASPPYPFAFGLVRYTSTGVLDASFGAGGFVVTPILKSDAEVRTMAIQPDGKIVVAGKSYAYSQPPTGCCFALARYNPDGSLDTFFGAGGSVTVGMGATTSEANGLALQPDGKIVLVGEAYGGIGGRPSFAVARVNSDGTLDSSFGTGGKVLTSIGNFNDGATSVLLQSDGKIVVGGTDAYNQSNGNHFVLVRYNPDGSLDNTFQGGGIVITQIGSNARLNTLVTQPNGLIVAAGTAYITNGNDTYFALARYNSDGSLDSSFGTAGTVLTNFTDKIEEARGLALQTDGKIVAVGTTNNYRDTSVALARYNVNGSLDTTFNGTGTIVSTLAKQGNSVAIQVDGKIVVGAAYYFTLLRYNSDGSLDSSFGTGGMVQTDFGSAGGIVNAVLLQPDNKIVAAGRGNPHTDNTFAIARYVTSVLSPPRCSGERFTDVCPGDFFYDPVLLLNDAGIISGYNSVPPCDNTLHIPCFKPFNDITRGQISKVVSLAAGFNEGVSGHPFEDVPPSNTFYLYIERMATRGIIGGYPCGTVPEEPCVAPGNRSYFRPGTDVTRGQLSKIASIAFGFNEPVSGQTFEDVPATNVFYQYIERMAGRGIIGGYPCGGPNEFCIPPDNRPYFRPNNIVTRGQASKMVQLGRPQPTATPTSTATALP